MQQPMLQQELRSYLESISESQARDWNPTSFNLQESSFVSFSRSLKKDCWLTTRRLDIAFIDLVDSHW